jgi:hypothetical protein
MNDLSLLLRRTAASTLWLRCTVLLGVALADLLFYRQPTGWTVGAFLLFAGLLLAARPAPAARRPAMGLALAALAASAGAVAYTGGALGGWLALLALAALAGARIEGSVRHADLWAWAALRAAACIPFAWLRDRRFLHRRRGHARRAASGIPRAVAAWVIPVLLAGIFLWLFCAANPVIERGVNRTLVAIGDFLRWLSLPELLRVGFWLLSALLLWGAWRVRAYRARRQRVLQAIALTPPPLPGETVPDAAQPPPPLPETPAASAPVVEPPAPLPATPGLALRCLALFNVLFAVETVVDLVYLWGGRALPEGMTYAQYAHRGAYPLVATAILSAILTLLFFRPGGVAEGHRAARGLVFAWLAQNVLLTASAAWRLHLYVNVYTLTELRVAAFVWMALVAFGLVAIVGRIALRRDSRWLLDVNTVALLAVLLVCAWWPIPGSIAAHNVRHCREAGGGGPSLDLAYLRELGPEAIPALRDYARLEHAQQKEATRLAEELTNDLRRELFNPRAWTWRRAALLEAAGVR